MSAPQWGLILNCINYGIVYSIESFYNFIYNLMSFIIFNFDNLISLDLVLICSLKQFEVMEIMYTIQTLNSNLWNDECL